MFNRKFLLYIFIGVSAILFLLFSPAVYYLYKFGLLDEPHVDNFSIEMEGEWFVPVFTNKFLEIFTDFETSESEVTYYKKDGLIGYSKNDRVTFKKVNCEYIAEKQMKFQYSSVPFLDGAKVLAKEQSLIGISEIILPDKCILIWTNKESNFEFIQIITQSDNR